MSDLVNFAVAEAVASLWAEPTRTVTYRLTPDRDYLLDRLDALAFINGPVTGATGRPTRKRATVKAARKANVRRMQRS